jgi:transcription initiation factor IIE alpha subunit
MPQKKSGFMMDQERVGDPVASRLDILISMLMPSAQKSADKASGLQYEILALCDYEHTTEDICKATKKTSKHVGKELSLLRSKGLIKTVKRDDRSVHLRI